MFISENFIETAFKVGRLHGRLGIPKIDYSEFEYKIGRQAVDSYNHGYDHGYMEKKTARTTNEDLDLDEISDKTLHSYVDKAELSKKDHLTANLVSKKPAVQQFHDRIMKKRHEMQQKAIQKLKG